MKKSETTEQTKIVKKTICPICLLTEVDGVEVEDFEEDEQGVEEVNCKECQDALDKGFIALIETQEDQEHRTGRIMFIPEGQLKLFIDPDFDLHNVMMATTSELKKLESMIEDMTKLGDLIIKSNKDE